VSGTSLTFPRPATRHQKIRDLDNLAALTSELKNRGKKVVLCHGVFDLLHPGHIWHFEQAKRMGDVLIVTITQDRDVNKGPHRPAFPQALRAEALAALEVVNYVAINQWPQSVQTIELLKPDVYVKGPDYRSAADDISGGIIAEADAVKRVGGEIRFTEGRAFSSSSLLNVHFSPFVKEVDDYLDAFRVRHSLDEILEWLDKAACTHAVVVGDAIVDEYLFCTSIGKSTKDPVLAVLHESVESYAGGSLAVANHVAGLCKEVHLVTQIGDTDECEDLIRSALRPNVEASFVIKSGCPTVHKRRIVDRYSGAKLLEIYVMDDRSTSGADSFRLLDALGAGLDGRDLAIVADYGHGMLIPAAVERLCSDSPFLAINVQSNAGNRGFNPVSKYHRADYLCLAMHEVEIETRQREGDIRNRVVDVLKRIACPRITVTLGKSGSIHYDDATGFCEAPSLATHVMDRVGAGDAVLAITSLLVRLQAPWDVIAFFGNVAGAHLVAELGNRAPLDRVRLSKHITSLLQ
jgi:rfaE bifunctional protein nucleotidyltransferase chain/domain